ncbi:UDP-N-acetylmuramoyl-tripeptide--D-alanyl-D-alanine ligase [Carboxylicivirga sp. M1479]|uniref:UDP-N-acetylmuramoyl-tripeptide--D-alanyl-D- alanine ligase n=1 Tax=Carboxylicivirga sp. M1479 TaxID=2594476 RepID=UPI001178BA86|nr:UDP-N-acetylmuramoyl-tripeptide--D-alanyl-D-alanine ligase [Carboxylicivirga sp. M1479]TRX65773.1 UDP-N-acetylmuramoyl-tripeptide--D-alanyl-D-alanine ligase [Carboxylicivirga sp. M1479]
MSQIAAIHQAFLSCSKVSTDSRGDNTNALFIALKGDNFDGNKYALDVLNKGAAFAIVSDPALAANKNTFIVDDTLQTLQELANFHRRYLEIPIVAITGTNGKTTTKELVAAVLAKKFNIKATSGNFNNHIGVPLTLLSMDKSLDIGIVEMGANHVGEIELLCKIAEPNYGLITNVGKAHLEGFGSFEGVKTAKGELYQYLKNNNGFLFINKDNEYLQEMANTISNRTEYGIESGSIKGHITNNNPFIELEWQTVDNTKKQASTQLIGDYNLENILSAICIGHHLGVSTNDINKAIQDYTPTNNRSQFIQSDSNQIIMDAYNANPSSMQVAIQNFANIEANNKVLILGGMKELGDDCISEHKKLISQISNLQFDKAMLIGQEFDKLSIDTSNIEHFTDNESLISRIKKSPFQNSYILIKGSRSNKLEEILEYI